MSSAIELLLGYLICSIHQSYIPETFVYTKLYFSLKVIGINFVLIVSNIAQAISLCYKFILCGFLNSHRHHKRDGYTSGPESYRSSTTEPWKSRHHSGY